MPVTRKRKAVSPEPSKQTTLASQKSINSYGRVTKNQDVDQSAKKRKVLESVAITTSATAKNASNPSKSRAHEETQKGVQPPLKAQKETRKSKKRSREEGEEKEQDEEKTTPQNKRFRNALPPTPAETPSKTASKLFERLNIATVLNPPILESKEEVSYDTPPLTPRSFKGLGSSQPVELPPPVQDLMRLFSCFLTSTSLYCAHHGLGTPLYITTLLPHVTKAWKKRAIAERDIRIVLGVLGKDNQPFELADNGEGSLCLELLENGSTAPGHFNQPELTRRFQSHLSKLWNEWASTSPTAKGDVEGFLHQLPQCEIIASEVAPSNKGGLSRGQERLLDLKSGAVIARAAEATSRKPLVKADARTTAAVSNRGSSLLDRILAKQAANASRGAGPTQEELNRRAALDRIPDIARVLDLLANGRPRASFSTKTMLSHLQNSLRNPISGEEVERCLDLMAGEITPTFVSMIQVGQVRGIVITRAGKPSADELKQRLERAHR